MFSSILLRASVSHGRLSGNMNLTEVSVNKTYINIINLPFYSLFATEKKVLGLLQKNIFENNWKSWNDFFGLNWFFHEKACFTLIVAFFSSGCRLMELFGGEQFGIIEQSLL